MNKWLRNPLINKIKIKKRIFFSQNELDIHWTRNKQQDESKENKMVKPCNGFLSQGHINNDLQL